MVAFWPGNGPGILGGEIRPTAGGPETHRDSRRTGSKDLLRSGYSSALDGRTAVPDTHRGKIPCSTRSAQPPADREEAAKLGYLSLVVSAGFSSLYPVYMPTVAVFSQEFRPRVHLRLDNRQEPGHIAP